MTQQTFRKTICLCFSDFPFLFSRGQKKDFKINKRYSFFDKKQSARRFITSKDIFRSCLYRIVQNCENGVVNQWLTVVTRQSPTRKILLVSTRPDTPPTIYFELLWRMSWCHMTCCSNCLSPSPSLDTLTRQDVLQSHRRSSPVTLCYAALCTVGHLVMKIS